MPPNSLLFYCSNLWALTTSAPKFLPGLLLAPRISTPPTTSAPNCKRGGTQVNARTIFTADRRDAQQKSTRIQVNARHFHRAYFQRPKLQKGGYLYTPQIKFGRILNNSRFGHLCTVFLRRRHSAFLQMAPISRPAASARCLFSANAPD